jgi:hypothetical protein
VSRADDIARIRIVLLDVTPQIWRTIEVPSTVSLRGLHDAIQAVVPFDNRHLFLFEIGDRRYGIPDREWDADMRDAKNIRIGALIDRGVTELGYTYDFGDDWRFHLTIEDVLPVAEGESYPRLVGGARRGPPEDVGGFPGFEEFLSAMGDPTHERHAELSRWYGRPFDPAEIDHAEIAVRLAKLVRRREIGKASHAKNRNKETTPRVP